MDRKYFLSFDISGFLLGIFKSNKEACEFTKEASTKVKRPLCVMRTKSKWFKDGELVKDTIKPFPVLIDGEWGATWDEDQYKKLRDENFNKMLEKAKKEAENQQGNTQ